MGGDIEFNQQTLVEIIDDLVRGGFMRRAVFSRKGKRILL
jgi:hypothetical protein